MLWTDMIPRWLSLLVASAVILFALYRLWLTFGGPSDAARAEHRRGMLAMPRRQHGAIGFIYLAVAAALIATSFGWNPFRRDAEATAPASKPPAGIIVQP